jgi:hypothetical protein
MIIITMTYFKRQQQLTKTLLSINNSCHPEFSVIIINDCEDQIILPDVKYPIEIIHPENKSWTDRDIPANIGFKRALELGADIIISQNAECYHVGDVISFAEKTNDNNYISFSAFDLDQENTFKEHDINELITENNICVEYSGQLGWYNHPQLRPVGFDFCASISRNNLIKLNGFDERFSSGVGYGDDYWIHRINKLGLETIIPNDPFVVHQWHESTWNNSIAELKKKNFDLFNELKQTEEYRALHSLTPDFV